ncbi:hypothetical protein BN1723_010758 [Verticillium longisporum]|uniref:Uncharacterized protein n=1 Tax=Verticillium longisporum TaxID=100787 RepID=A0A0G4L0Y4_VERLO|nr:hypothetical protein BN1723_010758 [Verticillium longisporum]CRK26639.1 hypothetical protein BN1708_014607 [Verticillium longisporum]
MSRSVLMGLSLYPAMHARILSFFSPPTIDHNLSPINIAPRPANEHQHNSRHLLHPAHAPKRVPPRPDGPRLREPGALIEYRVQVARADGVDADAVPRPLGREAPAEHDDRRLGRVVRGLRLREVDARPADAGREDEAPAAPARDHGPRDGLRAEERARGVDVEGAAEGGGRRVEGRRACDDAGRADEGVDAAVGGLRGAEGGRRGADGVFGRHVYFGQGDGGVRVGLAQRLQGGARGCRGRVDVPETEGGAAVLEEGVGDGGGEGAGAAGDDGGAGAREARGGRVGSRELGVGSRGWRLAW